MNTIDDKIVKLLENSNDLLKAAELAYALIRSRCTVSLTYRDEMIRALDELEKAIGNAS